MKNYSGAIIASPTFKVGADICCDLTADLPSGAVYNVGADGAEFVRFVFPDDEEIARLNRFKSDLNLDKVMLSIC